MLSQAVTPNSPTRTNCSRLAHVTTTLYLSADELTNENNETRYIIPHI